MYSMPWNNANIDKDIEQITHGMPVFKENIDMSLQHNSNGANHLLFNGNSFHSLVALLATYENKVDAIYLDIVNCLDSTMLREAKFMTGEYQASSKFTQGDAKSKTETNNSLDWLKFLKPRLDVAKELLADNGSIFISVDDSRQPWSRLLLDEVFGIENFVSNAVWKNRSGRASKINPFADDHEYLVVYAKNKKRLDFIKGDKENTPISESSIIDNPKLGNIHTGKNELKKMLGVETYSKPLKFVQGMIRLLPNKNAVILDFLASAGVTAHAVAELNKEDKGARQSISITGDEIAYQRISRAFTGKDWTDGKSHRTIKENLHVFDVRIREIEEGSLDSDKAHSILSNHVDMAKIDSQMFDIIESFKELNEETFQENAYTVLCDNKRNVPSYSIVIDAHDYEMQKAEQWAHGIQGATMNVNFYGSGLENIKWIADSESLIDDLTFRFIDSHRKVARKIIRDAKFANKTHPL